MLTVASDDDLAFARYILFASGRIVAALRAGMTACFLGIATLLLTAGDCIFAFPRSMARLPAVVGPASQPLAADLTAQDFGTEAGLVLERFSLAEADFLHQVRTARTWFLIAVTAVIDPWMTAQFRSLTGKSAWGRACSTW
jgi:hypothetical protein